VTGPALGGRPDRARPVLTNLLGTSLLLAALVLAACGGGDDSGSQTLGPGVTAQDIADCLEVQHDWDNQGKGVNPSLRAFVWEVQSPGLTAGQVLLIFDEDSNHPQDYDLRIAAEDGHAVDVSVNDPTQPFTDEQKSQVYDCASGE
jgi:hypothetical protein